MILSQKNIDAGDSWIAQFRLCLGLFLFGCIILPFVALCWDVLANSIDMQGYTATFDRLYPSLNLFFYILIRSASVALATTLTGTIVAKMLTMIPYPGVRLIALALLTTPLFVSDAVRGFAWADMTLTTSLKHILPLYRPYSSFLPLVLVSLPIPVLIISFYYVRTLRKHQLFFEEINTPLLTRLGLVEIPLLAPGILLSFIICFGFVFGASAEENFLGGPMPNSFSTLIESLLRSGIEYALLFSIIGVIILLIVAVLGLPIKVVGYFLSRIIHRIFEAGLKFKHLYQLITTKNFSKPGLNHSINLNFIALTIGVGTIFILICIAWIPLIHIINLGVFAGGRISEFGLSSPVFSIFYDNRISDAFQRSLILAIGVGLWAMCVSVIGFIVGFSNSRPFILLVLCFIAFFLPGEVTSLGIQSIASTFGINHGSIELVFIGHALWILPFATVLGLVWGIGTNRLESISLIEFGFSFPKLLWFSIIKRNIVLLRTAFLFGVIMSLNEYVRSSFLGGRDEGLSSVVYGRLSAGLISGEMSVFGASTVTIFLGLIIVSTCFLLKAETDA